MMGKKVRTGKLFYHFNLEERVPTDHLLRRVSVTVDFSFVTRLTARFYSNTGQPSVDPVVLFKMVLLGYLYGITSERRLVQEIDFNLAYRWFVGYDLDEDIPDHSVLSKARKRFGPTVYQAFFTEIVRQCDQAGLIRGDKLYVDSTLVAANASLDSVSSRALVRQLPTIGGHVADLWRDNSDEADACSPPSDETPPHLRPVPSPAENPQDEPRFDTGVSALLSLPAPVPSSGSPVGGGPDDDAGCEPDVHCPVLHLAGKEDAPNAIEGGANGWAVSRTESGRGDGQPLGRPAQPVLQSPCRS